ncbi:MAG: hypothetical protein J6I85_06985 [Clostridia bacterium]|nr:hypothetical protein [Clostridia bacterium]MBP3801744.1 hypothetical protein [Clostridia bacterium]
MKKVKINKKSRIIIVITFIILVWIVYDFTPLIKVPLANIIYGTSKCTLYNRKKTEDSLETFLLYSDRDHPAMGRRCNNRMEM